MKTTFLTNLMVLLILGVIAVAPWHWANAEQSPLTQGLIEAAGMGTVDMAKTKNKIQAKLLAKRAAMVDAQRNLLEMVEGVRITSGTTVKDAQLQSDLIANRVKGLLQGAFIVDQSVTEEQGDLLAEVKLAVCINNVHPDCQARERLSSILLKEMPSAAAGRKFSPPTDAAGTQVTRPTTPVDSVIERYSGLIVDLTGTGFEPRLVFNLVTTDGAIVYGPQQFNASTGADWMQWADSLDSARLMTQTVGAEPLIIEATGDATQTDILLRTGDALGIYEANLGNGNFLGKGRVVIVSGSVTESVTESVPKSVTERAAKDTSPE